MNNYIKWDQSYSSARRLAKWEREDNRRILVSVLISAGIWATLFYLIWELV